MDVHDDIIIVAPQFGWGNAVHRDIIFPMFLGEHIDFPESKRNSEINFFINLHNNLHKPCCNRLTISATSFSNSLLFTSFPYIRTFMFYHLVTLYCLKKIKNIISLIRLIKLNFN